MANLKVVELLSPPTIGPGLLESILTYIIFHKL